jgi:hypothetical protein
MDQALPMTTAPDIFDAASSTPHLVFTIPTMESQVQNNHVQDQAASRRLPVLDTSRPHTFLKPEKRINEGHDVPLFLTSRAYSDIGVFIMQLNIAMCPRKPSESGGTRTWQLDGNYVLSEPVQKLQELLQKIDSIIEEAPPDTGPRRFGNVSFRKWYEILESRVQGLLETHLPRAVLDVGASPDGTSVLKELTPYLLGGFGSAQRLDYGTGHELSFLAFLGCIWRLGGFSTEKSQDGDLERSLVLGVIEPYVSLDAIFKSLCLILTTATCELSVVLFLHIPSNLPGLTESGVLMIILSCRTSLAHHSIVQLSTRAMRCRSKALCQVPQIQVI